MKSLYGAMMALLFGGAALGQTPPSLRSHPDHVPDEKTAKVIGEAVLIARFGQKNVDAQRPLIAIHSSVGDYWMVQGGATGMQRIGGGMAVWINQHSGCIEGVFTHMK
jgi:hypothetical protein